MKNGAVFFDSRCSILYYNLSIYVVHIVLLTYGIHQKCLTNATLSDRKIISSLQDSGMFDVLILLTVVFYANHFLHSYTSSPAVAEGLRDASCLSVVTCRFNSTMRRAQPSVISYFRFRFTAAYK